jgi:hypothetical protein
VSARERRTAVAAAQGEDQLGGAGADGLFAAGHDAIIAGRAVPVTAAEAAAGVGSPGSHSSQLKCRDQV